MYNPTVSVIINTHNRANHLKRLLDCLTKQTYDNFEVIVVNGPSTDHTQKVLDEYASAIRIETCPEINLCMSRNIGVRAAAGEIVAFIDDDAVPENNRWLEKAAAYFEESVVGIVGGAVLRIGGEIEFQYGCFSIWGEDHCVSASPDFELEHGWYRRGAGGNIFIRRSAIEAVGGFDSYYLYYMDELDLCFRIAQKGYKIEYGEHMAIIHEAAKGANRRSKYDLNWDIIARSRTYFTMKASENTGVSLDERKKRAIASCDGWLHEFKTLCSKNIITKSARDKFTQMLQNGIADGIRDGVILERQLDYQIKFHPEDFKVYDKRIFSGINICFLCEDNPLTTQGGVPVYTKALAYGLIKKGHNVYIISKGTEEIFTNIDGINICYVIPENIVLEELSYLPVSQNRINFAYTCFAKLQQLKECFFVDLVESPIWDSYGVVISYLEGDIPLVTRLQTPLKMVLNTFQKENNPDYDLLIEYESALLEKSDAIISISDCIKETIESLYELKFSHPVYKNYLGFPVETRAIATRKENDGKTVVFFIGRLERRKGIDSIIAAIPELMDKYPTVEFHLAGDYEIFDEVIGDTYKNKLFKENRGAAWLKRVKFLGKISDEEKEQEFADCDIFVSPSLYESFGIIFVEAMRYSKPVIGCRAGGMQELIVDGETGLLAEPGDAESFKTCLEQMLKDPDMCRCMGQAGRSRMEQMFTEQKMCEESAKIYHQIIQDWKNRIN